MLLKKVFEPIVSGLNGPDEWGLEARIGERKKVFHLVEGMKSGLKVD